MSYHSTINDLGQDAERLEEAYQSAIKAGEAEAFKEAMDEHYASWPDNGLYAAWYHRLKQAAAQAKGFAIAWSWVIPLAVLNGLLFWWLSDESRYMIEIARTRTGAPNGYIPALFMLAGPIAAAVVLTYLTVVSRKRWVASGLIGVGLGAVSAYGLLVYRQVGTRPFQEQYVTLVTMHLPLLCWAGLGISLILRHRDPANRFAFLIKSLEVFVLGGLFVIAGGVFTGITIGLFDALNVVVPEVVQRLFIFGGAGLIPVVATAMIYDPTRIPAEQPFDQGLSKLVAGLTRLMLPLTALVLVVYLAFIPFNFRAPFENRDVLIIYNGMLFAVMALLVGATPTSLKDVSAGLGRWLRRGIMAVAGLAALVSIYALAAIIYRTALDRLTPNRLAFIGWNVLNTGLLALVLVWQVKAEVGQWLAALHRTYRVGTVAYAVWALALILALPWLFGIDEQAMATLPPAVQDIVYEYPNPILLKCRTSPHIYVLDGGEKRWIDSLGTFNARGYVWRDVHFVDCDALEAIPNGPSIPASAGMPPQS